MMNQLQAHPAIAKGGKLSPKTPPVGHAEYRREGSRAMTMAQASTVPKDDEGCLACHGDAGRLIGMVQPADPPPEDGCAAAPSRPDFLRAFVNEAFLEGIHGQLGCTSCHGGNPAASEMETAHAGLMRGEANCSNCHAEIVERHETSLHRTLNGMAHALKLRSGEQNFTKMEQVWKADCATCHTTCSDCHLAMPEAVGGGLIKGHEILRRAPMEHSCALCHGSRAGGEYLGEFEGLLPDVHFEAGMHCLDCHTNDLHGDGQLYASRWHVEGRAQCTDCHQALPTTTVASHSAVHSDVACQVCHSQPYQNCFNCHAGEEDGAYFRRAGAKQLLFEIGRNTAQGYPYGTVVLRNNPIARHSFEHFGENLLPGFDDHPTWKTAAPHNIRRLTPQNEHCTNCHDNPDIFLTEEDLDASGAAANIDVLAPLLRVIVGTAEQSDDKPD